VRRNEKKKKKKKRGKGRIGLAETLSRTRRIGPSRSGEEQGEKKRGEEGAQHEKENAKVGREGGKKAPDQKLKP